MTINKLIALEKGNENNSSGEDLAKSVNDLIDYSESNTQEMEGINERVTTLEDNTSNSVVGFMPQETALLPTVVVRQLITVNGRLAYGAPDGVWRYVASDVEAVNGVAVDFLLSGVTSMGVVIDGTEYSSEDGYLSFSDGGKVVFTLGEVPNPPSKSCIARVVIYSPEYPLGMPILSERSEQKVRFTFN